MRTGRFRRSAPAGWKARVQIMAQAGVPDAAELAAWLKSRGYGERAAASPAFLAAAQAVLAQCHCTETCSCPFTYDGDPYAEGVGDPQALVNVALQARAEGFIFAADGSHPNCAPFKAVLHQVDRPSDRAPGGTRCDPSSHGACKGHRVLISRAVAERRVATLVNMGLNMQAGLRGHRETFKVGVIKAAAVGRDPDPSTVVKGFRVDPNAVIISGCLYAKDFPREVAALRAAAATGELGTSYEADVAVANRSNPVWEVADLIYSGAAALWCNDAAYQQTQLAAQRQQEDRSMPDEPNPNPTPTPTPDPLDERIKAAIASAVEAAMGTLNRTVEALRSECSARMQAVEGAVAAMRVKPGDSPEELQMREQAQGMEDQARALDPKILEQKETAAALRSEGREADAVRADEGAAQMVQQAATLRANAGSLRAKAFGFQPILLAAAGLITDSESRIKALVTDQVASVLKLITDRGGPGGGTQGGPSDDQPQRRSLSASAMRLLSKFPDVETKGITIKDLNDAMDNAGLSTREQVGMTNELSRSGHLRR